jgi:hypothetical protein
VRFGRRRRTRRRTYHVVMDGRAQYYPLQHLGALGLIPSTVSLSSASASLHCSAIYSSVCAESSDQFGVGGFFTEADLVVLVRLQLRLPHS